MIEKFKGLSKGVRITIIIVGAVILLAVVGAFLPDLPEDEAETTEKTTTVATTDLLGDSFDIDRQLVYDDLFNKTLLIYEVSIYNYRDFDNKPNHNFKFYNSNGAEVQRTYAYKLNDNDCGFSFPNLRPGGIVTCTIAYEVTHLGEHELEVWLGKRGPWQTYPINITE